MLRLIVQLHGFLEKPWTWCLFWGESVVCRRSILIKKNALWLQWGPHALPCGAESLIGSTHQSLPGMFHANYRAPGKRGLSRFHSRSFRRGKCGQAEKEGYLLITKPPLIESSSLDCLMNPRPPRARVSTQRHRVLLSEEWLSESLTKLELITPCQHSLRILPAAALLRAPGSARATEDRPLL